jgi:hypothetical protein
MFWIFVVFKLFSPIFHYVLVKFSINIHEVLKVLKFKGFMNSFQIYGNDYCILFKHESHVHDFCV